MAVNLATKYAEKIQQKFTAGSLVDGRLSNDYSFVGAKTVVVSTIGTVAVNDYDRTAGSNRYGAPEEVQDTKQELTMTQDKSFTGIIDKGNTKDQNINKAGKFLSVQINEVITPMMDKYKLEKLAAAAGTTKTDVAITAENVIARMSEARKVFLNNRVTLANRTWFVTTDIFSALVNSLHFKYNETLGLKAICKGHLGYIFEAPVVEVPEDIMPVNTNFILVHKNAACAPVKIAETKVHIDPPGISGNLVEGRYYYDCFVFDAKKMGVYVDKVSG